MPHRRRPKLHRHIDFSLQPLDHLPLLLHGTQQFRADTVTDDLEPHLLRMSAQLPCIPDYFRPLIPDRRELHPAHPGIPHPRERFLERLPVLSPPPPQAVCADRQFHAQEL